MSGRTMPTRLDRQPAALRLAEWAAVAVFVIAVYEVVVAGGVALWPHADDAWILALWVAAAAISASGMTTVRGAVRRVFVRIRPAAAGPYATLVAFASGVAAAPMEETLPRLAELVAQGTGARQAEVWLADRDGGFRRASSWPGATEPASESATEPATESATVASFAALAELPQASEVVPVSDGGEVLGAFTVAGFDDGYFTPRDLSLVGDVANAAGLLLRTADLEARLVERVQAESAQAEILRESRRRVVAARDTAREQIGQQIQTEVCDPLEALIGRMSGLHAEIAGMQDALPAMTGEVEGVITRFRRVVRGVYPSVLVDHGLEAALGNLLETVERPTTLEVGDVPRCPPQIEACVYFCLATMVRGWPDGEARLRIAVTAAGERLRVTMVDPQASEMTDIATAAVLEAAGDRIAALDGTLTSSTDSDGLHIEIDVPATEPQ
ncbi:GAF domain-containing protein [Catenulispora sp. EB89]|uniref:GAF domain-containing protein n=1 Tax=Catenulispora sp. EB89 TaxID=3156257 RepID=UPI00351307E6